MTNTIGMGLTRINIYIYTSRCTKMNVYLFIRSAHGSSDRHEILYRCLSWLGRQAIVTLKKNPSKEKEHVICKNSNRTIINWFIYRIDKYRNI